MMFEISSIDSKQTAKVVAIATTLISFLFTIIGIVMLIIGIVQEDTVLKTYSWTYILMPIFYFIIVYVFSRLFYWIYNKVAAKTGGIRLEMEESEDIQ